MVSRALKTDEQDLTAHLIGRDGIAMIVNAANPVTALSNAEIVAIYTGEQQNWSSLGGDDAAITVVHKADGRSTQELFLAHFGLNNDQVQPDMVIGENQQGIKAVANDVNAIGYVSIGTAIYEADAGAPCACCPCPVCLPHWKALIRGAIPESGAESGQPGRAVRDGQPAAGLHD